MIIAPVLDIPFINAVVNSPDVRPFVGGDGVSELDLSDAVNAPENWFLMGEHGGFALTWSAPGVHEVHTFIRREGRGAWAREAAREGIEYAIAQGDWMLWTRVPPQLPHVAAFARGMGMVPAGREILTFGIPYAVYKMELRPCLSLQ